MGHTPFGSEVRSVEDVLNVFPARRRRRTRSAAAVEILRRQTAPSGVVEMQAALQSAVLENGNDRTVVQGGRKVIDLFVARRSGDGIGQRTVFVIELRDRIAIVGRPLTTARDGILKSGRIRPCAEVLASGGGLRIGELPRSHAEVRVTPTRDAAHCAVLRKFVCAEGPGDFGERRQGYAANLSRLAALGCV